ncbi:MULTISPECIES: hypothetical protein [unclassified Streptomyces]|uniref:hypothetical protein n=1 Tax=unclassified Streptomyces TaxID=2593676 RepID=UPI0016612D05|nr:MULTISPECIES: hypothetical protein [unclassified Streptomyces]MBD0711023.1 hypothetical protein [Streptomyces sp. CBMA291]MBD0712975.1 hypothetical protein [Streptomyces sp. CBMA370]
MTPTRPARLTGAALSAALTLLAAVWVLKDLAAFGSPSDLAWYWAGDHHFLLLRGGSATSLVDPVLLVASAATAVAALRSRHAASAFAATGAVTLALRFPGLWSHDSAVLVTALLDLALATALVGTASLGRGWVTPYDQRPTRPRTGPGVAAGVLLAVAALVMAAWELYWVTELPLEITLDRLTGGRSVVKAVLAPPPAWLSLVLVALYGAAAVSALGRARHGRAFGLLAGTFLAAGGLAETARTLRYELVARFADIPTADRLDVLTAGYGLLAGAAVLVLLAGRGVPAAAPSPAGMPSPAPPSPPPPGW